MVIVYSELNARKYLMTTSRYAYQPVSDVDTYYSSTDMVTTFVKLLANQTIHLGMVTFAYCPAGVRLFG